MFINIREAETKIPFYYRQYNLLWQTLELIKAFSNAIQDQQIKMGSFKNKHKTYTVGNANFTEGHKRDEKWTDLPHSW